MTADRSRSYEAVPLAEDHDDRSSSTTEVEQESLTGAKTSRKQRWTQRRARDDEDDDDEDIEKTPLRRRRSKAGRTVSRLRMCWWIVDTLLLLVIVGLLLMLHDLRSVVRSSPYQVGGDFTGEGPRFSAKVVKWESDPTFVPEDTTEFFSEKTLARWNTLMPENAGWDPALMGQTFFTTSMTHSLHCLLMMGRIFAGVSHNDTSKLPSDWSAHYNHCIDYLRQAIMCAGDVALEPHGPNDSDDLGPLDGGWNGMHVCKDYGEVTRYLEGQIRAGVRTVLPIDD